MGATPNAGEYRQFHIAPSAIAPAIIEKNRIYRQKIFGAVKFQVISQAAEKVIFALAHDAMVSILTVRSIRTEH